MSIPNFINIIIVIAFDTNSWIQDNKGRRKHR